jgi:hypothetical protein
MATTSRTYLPSDWQVWTYTPVSGKFRLDFSTLGGSDVLGGVSDTGSIQAMDLSINSIQLQDGQRPQQSVFSSFEAGTLAFSAQLLTYDATLVRELYNGKLIFLTLKNQAVNVHPTFGNNTVFFIGQIDSLDIQIDPVNRITNLTVTAVDVASAAMNFPITITTNVSKAYNVSNSIAQAVAAGQMSQYIDATALLGVLGATFENIATVTKTMGEWMEDYIAGEVAVLYPQWTFVYDGLNWQVKRRLFGTTIAATSTSGTEAFLDSQTTGLVVSQDGGNVPTAFDLSNSTGNYNFGTTTANTLSNPAIYSAGIDVPTSFLPTIANKILEYTQKIQPTEITIKTATTYQPIVFDNARSGFGNDYYWPKTLYQVGQETRSYPAYLGGGTFYHRIVGISHIITPDDWQTTYQLWKGL